MRLFIAIPIPEDIKKQLIGLQRPLDGVHWVPEEQLHLTLKFVGNPGEASALQLKKSLGEIRFEPFDIFLESTGFFPERGKPRVYWAGVSQQDKLLDLQRKTDKIAIKAGSEKGRFNYIPHVTLARIRGGQVKRDQIKSPDSDFQSRIFIVDRFILFQSLLRPEGAVHKVVTVYQNNSG